MRIDATVVEEAIRAVLQELGLAWQPITFEYVSGWQTGDPLLGEDRDAPQSAGAAVFIVRPQTSDDLQEVYLIEPSPNGTVEVATVDLNLRAIRLGKVADAVWERLAAQLNVTVDRLLAFDD